MYIEKRSSGKQVKYYLVHSYRNSDKVQKIRKYLGSNLSQRELSKAKQSARRKIQALVEEMNTEVFLFSLSNKQIESINKLSEKIDIVHLKEDEWRHFTEEFVYHTNAIEGSTVTEAEVHEILKKKEVQTDEEIETKGVANAIHYIRNTKDDLSLKLILKLHDLCFKDSKQYAGKFRDLNVVIRNARGDIIHTGVSKDELQDYLEDFVEWYHEHKHQFKPLALAAIIHNQFEYIHPFQDGNGRVGRLLLNFILLKNKYPPINILLEDRSEYYFVLHKYSKDDDIKSTIHFLIKQYKKTLKEVTTK